MRGNGFTLVELMVVITVMALLAGAVVLTFPASGAGSRDAAHRFAARVAAARDTAVLTGRPVALWVSPSGYGFEQRSGGRWVAGTTRPLRQENWGRGVRAEVSGRARVGFDTVGLPDRALDVRLAQEGRSATVRIAANGDVAVP